MVVDDHDGTAGGVFIGEFFKIFGERAFGEMVQVEVEGGVYRPAVGRDQSAACEQQIYEMRGLKLMGTRLEADRFDAGAGVCGGIEVAAGEHAAEHPQLAGAGCGEMLVRVEAGRGIGQCG